MTGIKMVEAYMVYIGIVNIIAVSIVASIGVIAIVAGIVQQVIYEIRIKSYHKVNKKPVKQGNKNNVNIKEINGGNK